MPLTIERLRLGIVGLAALLLLTIAGSFFYGRWRLRHMVQDLPARLGVQIQQSTQGFELSQSNAQGRNLFTLHAARAIEFKSGGRVSLHDVKIELYNRQTGQPDTIAGDDFEYDPHTEIVQSRGAAYIVLPAPEANGNSSAANHNAGQPIRVATHDLIFNRKTGLATCSGEVDFATADTSGQAVGAQFDSKLGRLLLESKVVLTASMHGQPMTLHASRATYDRNLGQIDLLQPRYTSATPAGTNRGMAATATVFLRADNSAEQLDARGAVRLISAGGMAIAAPSMHVLLGENDKLRKANFFGGVTFADNQPGLDTRGNAQQTEVNFDAQGRANRVVMDGSIQVEQQVNSGKNASKRTLTANHLVLNLAQSTKKQVQLQSADAAGNAILTSQDTTPGRPSRKTILGAERLHATFAAQNRPQQVEGTGQTRLQMIAANGNIDTSTGDTLHVDFALPEPGTTEMHRAAEGAASAPLTNSSIRAAMQTGHVVLRQIQEAHTDGASPPKIATATAERASYIASDDTLTLTGDPVFRQGQIEMTARRIAVERATGNVVSTGAVEATMVSGNAASQAPAANTVGSLLYGANPVHIIASRAVVSHQAQTAIFSGAARFWQGEDAIEAPVIELSQKKQTLSAYGPPPCARCVISSFLAGAAGFGSPHAPVKAVVPSTFRVLSQSLLYSDAQRKVRFLHNVEVFSASGRMTADQVEVFLAAPARRAPAVSHGSPARVGPHPAGPSSIEKLVATGNVRLSQPGRSATGNRLIYTTADGDFVLTGSEKSPPQVMDRERGTVSGQVLTFASKGQAIMVSGAPGHMTTTRTRVQQR